MSPKSWDGLLVVDKPGGLTSRAAVDRAQRWFPRGTRVGHTGTLDPLATGVLVLCLGAATRLGEYVQKMHKTYRAGILLGARSDTDDVDGTITPVVMTEPPRRVEVEDSLAAFVGWIDQVPPAYSAAKVTGRRAYNLARRGLEVTLSPRRIHIDRIDVLAYDYPRLDLEIHCGKGTYIRSLARDLGQRLGCGGLVQTLRRTRVGPFETAAAVSLDADAATAAANVLPLSAAVSHLPHVVLPAAEIRWLRRGQAVPLKAARLACWLRSEEEAAVLDEANALVALVHVDHAAGLLRPNKVLKS
jgi:tRNA pseudouridine55 synthase